MKNRDASPLGLYTVAIAALFLAGFFLLVLFGTNSYRNTVAGQESNMQTRALLAYLATAVRAADTADAVTVGESEYGTVLILADGDSGYGQRVYRYAGDLVEEYASLDLPLSPESAQVLGPTERFEAEREESGLLRMTTDAGTVLVHVRCEGGAGA